MRHSQIASRSQNAAAASDDVRHYQFSRRYFFSFFFGDKLLSCGAYGRLFYAVDPWWHHIVSYLAELISSNAMKVGRKQTCSENT